ncbi:hypothetical protein AVEN_12675-1 [Araneus ventricosus]|uniref:Uncharacterized protein n=1 Tax=Araneus ventricosus TaxID=182803 RepID=A0A4Y2AB05_ARAVE|nr:hypothetical protein AVEN_12675-1 [Araneus ventricosus]
MAHSPHVLNAFTSENLTSAAEGKWAIHSTTPPAAHSPLLITSPNPPSKDLEVDWWTKVIKNKLSRIKTRNLVKFLLENESLLSPDSEQFLIK